MNATTVLLEPLAPPETEQLIDSLAEIDPALRGRVREASEGNPLFVEEMLAMLRESDGGDVPVPPTIQALLAARVDQLDPEERDVLQCGSVEGRIFHRGAVQALAPEESQVTARLTALVRKELIRPDRPQLSGEDAFRFRHLLICDAAYEALPKATRAALHERFADWLEQRGSDLVELDEILGYHLEQAYQYRQQLGAVGDAARRLAIRAAERLAHGGSGAQLRGDHRAAASLLTRATGLLPARDARRPRLLCDLALSLRENSQFARAAEVLDSAIELAGALGQAGVESAARIERSVLRIYTDPEARFELVLREIEASLATPLERGDERSDAHARTWAGIVRCWLGQAEAAGAELERAAEQARVAGDRRQEIEALLWLSSTLCSGPAPAEAALRRIRSIRASLAGSAMADAWLAMKESYLTGLLGRFAEARQLWKRADTLYEQLGLHHERLGEAMFVNKVERLAGDPQAAEQDLRRAVRQAREIGETGYLSTVLAELADTLCEQERYEEALRMTEEAEAIGAADDILTQIEWRSARAKALSHIGDRTHAEALAREAVELAHRTDYLIDHANALTALAEVLRLDGRTRDAVQPMEQALSLYRQKHAPAMAQQAQQHLQELRAGITSRHS